MRFGLLLWLFLMLSLQPLLATTSTSTSTSTSTLTVIYFDPAKVDDESSLVRIDWPHLEQMAMQLQNGARDLATSSANSAAAGAGRDSEPRIHTQQLKERLITLVQETLEEHGNYTIEEDAIGKKFLIADGLHFWHQMYRRSGGELDLHLINYFFLHQKLLAPDLAKTLYSLFGSAINIKQAMVLDLNLFSPSERQLIRELATEFNF